MIWRAAVIWSLDRKWLSAFVALIPFAQVIYAQPLWTTKGCANDLILSHGQHQITLGLWLWISIWVWWGLEKSRTIVTNGLRRRGIIRMIPMAKRTLACIGSLPDIFGLSLIAEVAREEFGWRPLFAVFAVTGAAVILIWLFIWRQAVHWSLLVVRQTIASVILCFGVPLGLVAFMESSFSHSPDWCREIAKLLTILGWGVWMAMTPHIWPLRVDESRIQAESPRCRQCRYLLTGLRGTRCPECGDEPTLDELWAATAGERL